MSFKYFNIDNFTMQKSPSALPQFEMFLKRPSTIRYIPNNYQKSLDQLWSLGSFFRKWALSTCWLIVADDKDMSGPLWCPFRSPKLLIRESEILLAIDVIFENEVLTSLFTLFIPSNWCRCFFIMTDFTFSTFSAVNTPLFNMFSNKTSRIWFRFSASSSRKTVPFKIKLLSSMSECMDKLDTWGLLHLLEPSSTSSSNLTHLAVSFHS